jgi:uncharacterized membrane protein
MDHRALFDVLARVIEVIGISVLIVGGAIAGVLFSRDWRRLRFGDAYHRLRANLGRAILLGLEVLIVADIIRTIAVEPTLHNLAVLGLLVLIRTFLSFALEVEIGGRLPWRRDQDNAPHHPGEHPDEL